MSDHHIIEQIISQADIVKIIGKHVELKRAGSEFKGCCPFHGEKTPSFFVNPQKGLYNCFGCHASGNALTFLKEYEHLTTREALQELSQQTGIELPKEPNNPNHFYRKAVPIIPQQEPIPQEIIYQNYHEFEVNPYHTWQPVSEFPPITDNLTPIDNSGNLYDLLIKINQFYQKQLWQNPFALNYFRERGLSDATILEFELGFAPNGWQHLEQAFPQDIEGLKILGLVRTSQQGKDFDLLRQRVIFPIRDHQGRTIGFAGRSLSDENQPKYINSSDSPVFHKQHVLYGLFEGRKAKAKNWLVVEGYMDVISLHQAGVYGAVASMGTAIATSQIDKLFQLNSTLTLCFDGDNAGQTASWRAMEASLPILTDSRELRFLTLPNQHDPDSFVKAYGQSAMQQQIEQAKPLSEYIFSILTRRYDVHIVENRSKLLNELDILTKKLPKGSYGWLLKGDIRKRLGLGKRQQVKVAQDALLNFSGELTAQLQLQLCFLYQPQLLGNQIDGENNSSLIERIYQLSGAEKVKQKNLTSNPDLPAYPQLTWAEIADKHLLALINNIQQIQLARDAFKQQINLDEIALINVNAHFILASLPSEQRQFLTPRWITFFSELSQRFVVDVSDLVIEILTQLILDTLQKKIKSEKQIVYQKYLRDQLQIIFSWHQQWRE